MMVSHLKSCEMLGEVVAVKVLYIILFLILYMIPYVPAHRASQFYFAGK